MASGEGRTNAASSAWKKFSSAGEEEQRAEEVCGREQKACISCSIFAFLLAGIPKPNFFTLKNESTREPIRAERRAHETHWTVEQRRRERSARNGSEE